MTMRGWLVLATMAALGAGWQRVAGADAVFTDAERERAVAYWNTPGRYRISAPVDAEVNGPWVTRLTADGSRWLHAYQRAVTGQEKPPPTELVRGETGSAGAWEAWVTAKYATDRWRATMAAANANAAVLKRPAPVPPPAPPAPGPIPPSLLAAVGAPPPFVSAVAPLRYVITFHDGPVLEYTDNVAVRDRYAYYRFPQGAVSYGRALGRMTDAELDPIFAYGMTPSEARVAKAVSRFEGGFDSVNTYDTGFVSVGFIQFITAENGDGSLAGVLRRQKQNAPATYEQDFRRYGIDVDADGVLAVVDPDTGAELRARDAVMKVIEDKRLIAAFQRAGRYSLPFRAAQVLTAKDRYWAGDDSLEVTVNGAVLTGKVSDVVRSEAGLATLFDRKVNRGTIRPLEDVVAEVMGARGLTTLAQAAQHEREIVARMKYRGDFLNEPALAQPPPPPSS